MPTDQHVGTSVLATASVSCLKRLSGVETSTKNFTEIEIEKLDKYSLYYDANYKSEEYFWEKLQI